MNGGSGSARPDTLAVLTPIGLLVGRAVLGYSGPVVPDNALTETGVIPFPAGAAAARAAAPPGGAGGPDDSGAAAGGGEVPVGFAVTEHHYVLAFPHRIVALSRITRGVAFVQHLPEDAYGSIRGIVLDPTFFDPASADSFGASGALTTCQVRVGGQAGRPPSRAPVARIC